LIDNYLTSFSATGQVIFSFGLLYLFGTIVKACMLFFQSYMYANASTRTLNHIRIELFKKIHTLGMRYFDQTPADGQLMFQIGMMNQFGADIGKIATMPANLQDVLRMMNVIQRAKGINQLPLAVMSMGDLGKVTRVAGELIGSVLSFASLDQASAPGQIPIDTMDEFIKAMQID